ncbi:MAG: ATP-dependent RecD-like DNA helicase [Lentisphaeraceae bacterium]|nr:ATP-dependent RecD-like DNA helicase [Lentisphaeraceae bacterium]
MGELFDQSHEHEENTSLSEQTIRGEILKVVFCNPDTNYAILMLLTEDKKEICVVGSGTLVNVSPGELIEAQGNWTIHKDWGKQFKASRFKAILPTNNAGLVRYLSSGNFPGIGPKTAERIVDTFGSETIYILDNYTTRLSEVPGLGKKKVGEIAEAWKQVADRREMDVFLRSQGVPGSYCDRIYNAYGERTADVLKNNPYQLAKDINGIGFTIADKIAREMGIELTNTFRLAAGIEHTLRNMSDRGHTCLPENYLVDQAAETLGVERSFAESGLQRAVLDGAVMADTIEGHPEKFIYKLNFFHEESRLAEKIVTLLNNPKKDDQEALRFVNDHLNDDQEAAVENSLKYRMSIITGGPGVGKTTTIDEIVQQAKLKQMKTYLAAPTGRAARRMSEATGHKAQTIHRMLIMSEEDDSTVFNEDKQLKCDLLIVDEVSMLDISLAYRLFSAIPTDATVVLVGDKDQLPSVGPGNVLHDFLSSGEIPVTTLSKVYRQTEGSKIISNAHSINRGFFPDVQNPPKGVNGDFYWIEKNNPEQIEEMIVFMMNERIPETFGHEAKEIQVLTPMNRGACGRESLNEKLQASLNSIHKNQFKFGEKRFIIGDRVMQITNNYDKKVFNGDLGYILDIDSKAKSFTVMFESMTVQYSFDDAGQLTLAYASTIHKSQGSEFPVVIIPLVTQHHVMLQRNLLYTGVTRAKKLIILVGHKQALQRCVENNRQARRCTQLSHRINCESQKHLR